MPISIIKQNIADMTLEEIAAFNRKACRKYGTGMGIRRRSSTDNTETCIVCGNDFMSKYDEVACVYCQDDV